MASIHVLESTESTNAHALAAQDAEHGETWLADEQTAGRGRREVTGARRAWFSPAGRNIYMSVMLRPRRQMRAPVSGVTLAVGASVCDALAEVVPELGTGLWLKWPNDLWVADAKLAGILTEARSTGTQIEAVVVGIGINVNVRLDEFPSDLAGIATSIHGITGVPSDRLGMALRVRKAIIAAADDYFANGWVAAEDAVRRWDRSAGRAVEVEVDGVWRSATASGIVDGGGLAVAVDGEAMVVTSGEVRFTG